MGPWLGFCEVFFGKIRYSHSTSLHRGIKMGSSNWCESLTKCCKGVGRRALRLTSLSFPVEEEICNTGLSHGQKGGWGNEDYARLRSFLVWETVFAHKRSCGRTQLALKLNIKQTFVYRSVSALKYRLRSNGRNIVKGINGSYTQRT